MDRRLSDYRTALDALFARTGSSKFGLERTVALLALMGNPHRKFPSFHVAGTNGKGSVVATLCALLRSKGLNVGRYMSPHLVDFRERVYAGDQPVSEEYILEALARGGSDFERMDATFFEITTAIAFEYFAASNVDVAVIETGLGGRLDATNVIHPVVAGITSIAMDHQEFLGDSERSIAREKAGIFKQRVPAVIGKVSAEARAGVDEVIQRAGFDPVIDAAALYRTSGVHVGPEGTTFTVEHEGERRTMTIGLTGAAQADNAAVALAMLRAAKSPWSVDLDEAARVLPQVQLPGRFQRVGHCILDVAHNPEGMRSLVATLSEIRPPEPVSAVVGILADKDWRGILLALSGKVERIVLVAPPSAPPTRAWNPVEAEEFARSNGMNCAFEPDFSVAVANAAGSTGTTLITGSFHTVGDALVELGQNTL